MSSKPSLRRSNMSCSQRCETKAMDDETESLFSRPLGIPFERLGQHDSAFCGLRRHWLVQRTIGQYRAARRPEDHGAGSQQQAEHQELASGSAVLVIHSLNQCYPHTIQLNQVSECRPRAPCQCGIGDVFSLSFFADLTWRLAGVSLSSS